MKTFALAEGDLVVGPRGYATVSGATKLRQDLGVAVREPTGGDRFHPGWGSTLSSIVGSQVNAATKVKVQIEVARVISNYIAVQQDVRKRDAALGRASRFSTGEIVRKIESVTVAQAFDSLRVRIVLRTVSDDTVTLNSKVDL